MHTPGPWTIGYHANTQDGYTKSTIRGGRFLNEVVSMKQHVGGRNFEELFANARLIAAAPALLEALEWVVNQLCGDSGTGHSYWEQFPEYIAARSAIAAARGEVTK